MTTIAPHDAVKFWARVRKTDGCWLFEGGSKNGSHGTMPNGEYAHRFSWRLHFGPIPDGLEVCHKCDVGRCVRPDHFFLGTQAENIADMWAKGRGVKPPVHRGETHHNATLNDAEIARLRNRFEELRGKQQRLIATEFGVSQSTVWRIGHALTR